MASPKTINLYYIGGFTNEKAIVSAKGMSFNVPPAGEYLNVPAFIAKDLIRRNRNEAGQSVFTTDAALVKKLMSAPPVPVQKKYSREELLEMLDEANREIEEDVKAVKAPAKAAAKKEEVN